MKEEAMQLKASNERDKKFPKPYISIKTKAGLFQHLTLDSDQEVMLSWDLRCGDFKCYQVHMFEPSNINDCSLENYCLVQKRILFKKFVNTRVKRNSAQNNFNASLKRLDIWYLFFISTQIQNEQKISRIIDHVLESSNFTFLMTFRF